MQHTRHDRGQRSAGYWLLSGALVLSGCQGGSQPPANAAVDSAAAADSMALAQFTDHPECVGHGPVRVIRDRQIVTLPQLVVPGLITDIPEFHDCQRFIDAAGSSYGPLVAIYASAKMDSLWPAHGQPLLPTLPVGEIYSYDGEYRPLRIHQYFNCLYLVKDATAPSGYSAYVRGVGPTDEECGKSFDPTTLPADTKLAVIRKARSPRYQDYPRVARWDWNPKLNQQYIGLECGAAWCSVSDPGLTESPDYDDNSMPMDDEKKVRRIKGWYDEQHLAVRTGTGLQPNDPVGTVIPDARLGDWNQENDFYKHWRPVARVAFSGFPANYPYYSKFGFTAGTMGGGRLNRVEMCMGAAAQCLGSEPIPKNCVDDPKGWWARIKPAEPGKPDVYRCAVRHDHSGMGIPPIPATARWRWLADDETLWVRCAQGCCTVTGEM